MKKVISILLLLVLAFGVCACAGKKSSSKAKQGHLGEWRLERFQWRTEFVQGVHFSSARLTVGESGEFEFALDYEKNNTPHQYGFSGSYTISGTDLTLKVEGKDDEEEMDVTVSVIKLNGRWVLSASHRDLREAQEEIEGMSPTEILDWLF